MPQYPGCVSGVMPHVLQGDGVIWAPTGPSNDGFVIPNCPEGHWE